MGSCDYFMKIAFQNGAQAASSLEEITHLFQVECIEAYQYWQNNRIHKKNAAVLKFFKDYERKFPLMAEYLKTIPGIWNKSIEAISGHADFGQEDDVNVELNENIIGITSSNVWHFSEWGPMTTFLQKKYNALKVVACSEEDGCASLESLDLYEWEEIVTSILNKTELLPLLIGIHSDLDIMIEPKLKKPK